MTQESVKDPGEVAVKLLKAITLPDEEVFKEIGQPKYTTVDYYRMACHILFNCKRCGNCCITGNPIRLNQVDMARIARHLKIPLNKAIKKYTIPDPDKPAVLNFKQILPCRFYDQVARGCKIYAERPFSCRIFPFLGIYGSEDKIKVHESCPGSLETAKVLTSAMQKLCSDPTVLASINFEEAKQAKEWFRHFLNPV